MNKEMAKMEINSLYNHLSETNKMALDVALEALEEVEKLKEALLLLYKSDRDCVDSIACKRCVKHNKDCDNCDQSDEEAIDLFVEFLKEDIL